jgi:transposase
MIKKKKKNLEEFVNIIPKYKNYLPDNISTSNTYKYTTDSWFDINITECEKKLNTFNYKTKFPKECINCKKVKMLLSNSQKEIINMWFKSSTHMYNKTVDYIKNTFNINKNNKIDRKAYNFIYIRSQLLNEKTNIVNNSQIKNTDKKTKIYTHTLDYTIKQLTTNIKSAITNLKQGNIKHFKIKKWKYNRPSQTLEIEKEAYSKKNKGLCYNILGNINYEYNNKPFILTDQIKTNVKINYNLILDEYTLLIPEKHKPQEIENKDRNNQGEALIIKSKNMLWHIFRRNIIILDPGLRVFMTGLTENDSVDIAPNINTIIREKLYKLNKIKNNKYISNRVKNKYEKNINRKIYNMVDDAHWKIIKFLTLNFRNVLIGDMINYKKLKIFYNLFKKYKFFSKIYIFSSAKRIVSKNNSILSNESKIACLRSRYYQFKQRLEYKCMLTKTNFRLIDESYTSKVCSNCGSCNDKLGRSKIYNCNNCNKIFDRDFNACRNIFMKSMVC